MKLYGNPFSCALAAHMVIEEAGLEAAYSWVHLTEKTTTDGENYYDINPKGKVPALALGDGGILSEGIAVLQYLADLAPDSGLAPAAGTFERAKLNEWLGYLATELHKKIFYPIFNPHAPEEAKAFCHSMLPNELAYLNAHLSDKNFLMGDTFTAADAYLATIINWMMFLKTDLTDYPHVAALFQRVTARPAVGRAMAAEAAMMENHPELSPASK